MKLSAKQQAELAKELAALARLAEQVRSEVDAELEVSRGNWQTVQPALKRNDIQPRRAISHNRKPRRTSPPPDTRPKPLPGEMRASEFARDEAIALETTPNAIWYRIRMGYYPGLKIRRINHSVVFFDTSEMKRLPMNSTGGRPNLSGLSQKTLGHKEYCRQLRQLKKAKGQADELSPK